MEKTFDRLHPYDGGLSALIQQAGGKVGDNMMLEEGRVAANATFQLGFMLGLYETKKKKIAKNDLFDYLEPLKFRYTQNSY